MPPLGEETLVPAPPDDPLARRGGLHPRRDPRHDRGNVASVIELHFAQHSSRHQQMVVGVDQSRHHRCPAQILDPRPRSRQRPHLVITANRHEAAIANGHRRRFRLVVINGMDAAIDEHHIGRQSIGDAGHEGLRGCQVSGVGCRVSGDEVLG